MLGLKLNHVNKRGHCRHCSGCSRWSNSIYAPRYWSNRQDDSTLPIMPRESYYANKHHATVTRQTMVTNVRRFGSFFVVGSFVFSQPATKLHDWCTCIFGSPARPTTPWQTPQLQHRQSRLLHLHLAQHHSGKTALPSHTQGTLLETGNKHRFFQ